MCATLMNQRDMGWYLFSSKRTILTAAFLFFSFSVGLVLRTDAFVPLTACRCSTFVFGFDLQQDGVSRLTGCQQFRHNGDAASSSCFRLSPAMHIASRAFGGSLSSPAATVASWPQSSLCCVSATRATTATCIRSQCLKRPVFALLKSTAGDVSLQADGGGGGGGDGSSENEGATENVLGAQAAQVLEFWRSRRPSPDLPVGEVVGLLMAALQQNDHPAANDGLRTVFDFSSGMCRRAVGSTAENFVSQARASVFGATVGCHSFSLDPLHRVGDRLATQVVNVTAADGRKRRFLWTLEQQRRPPDTGKWLTYGVVSSDVDGALVLEG